MAETFSTKSSKREASSEGGRPAREATPQSSSGPEARILHLQHAIGNRAVGRLLESQLGNPTAGNRLPAISQGASQVIQTKLTVSVPGDKYEQEADSVAEKVMRMQEPGASPYSLTTEPYLGTRLQRQCVGCEEEVPRAETVKKEPGEEEEEFGVAVDGDMPMPGGMFEEEEAEVLAPRARPGALLQRMCAGCEKETDLQAKESSGPTVDSSSVVHDFQGGGQPLNNSARNFFEPRFGYIFDKVRVHTDTRARESARAVNALAYTRGHDIVFGAGQYAPETAAGQRLLAHELTHIVQQNPSHSLTGSRLPNQPTGIQTATAMPNMLQRWHADGPADASANTIVCNGKGGVRVQIGVIGDADQTACLIGCVRKHEQSHRSDALAAKPKVCKGHADATQVTFNGEQKASEVKASNVEINCLKAIKASAKCKPIIKARIKQMKAYRDSF